jgi:lipopolysaccharide export system permease protein
VSFRASPSLLERYILRESVLPFLLGFATVTFLFVLDFLFDFLDLLIAKDVPFPIVLELFVLALGWIVALSFPCGTLVAALMTFGRLAQDNEITAMRAMGVNLAAAMRGPLIASVVLTGLLVLFNNYVLPETNHRFANLRLAIHRKSPAARIEPGIFIDAFDKASLLVKEVNPKTGEMRDITIYDYSESSIPTTILARRGHMEYPRGSSTLKLTLEDGEIHEVPGMPREGKYRRGKFDRHVIYLRQSGARLEMPDRTARGEREMNIQMMRDEIREREIEKTERLNDLERRAVQAGFPSYQAFEKIARSPRGVSGLLKGALGGLGLGRSRPDTTRIDPKVAASLEMGRLEIENLDRRIDSFKVEIHKKFSIPFACVVFVLIGAPLGIRTRRGGFANMAIAVAFFMIYYLFLIVGEQLADRRFLSPALAMWLPNLLFGVVGLYFTASVVGLGPSRGMR